MPSAYTILFSIILIMMMLTWIVPAGQYEYIQNGDISQPIAGTYHRVEANQQSIFDVILASFHGFYEAVEISLFILMVGGFLGVVMETGAINAGIARVIQKLKGREKYMIPILMILFGLGGTSFGMWEETMAFYPLLLPVFIAAGYDSITAVSVITANTMIYRSAHLRMTTIAQSRFTGAALVSPPRSPRPNLSRSSRRRRPCGLPGCCVKG